MEELYKACVSNNDEKVLIILNKNKPKSLKLVIPKNSLSIENSIPKGETPRTSLKTPKIIYKNILNVFKQNLKSPKISKTSRTHAFTSLQKSKSQKLTKSKTPLSLKLQDLLT